jgi:hypothetical protein
MFLYGSQISEPVKAIADQIILSLIYLASWFDRHLTEWIQPPMLRAPEVILRANWDYRVDIFNLGALVSRPMRLKTYITNETIDEDMGTCRRQSAFRWQSNAQQPI